jgi:hypothetical protein
MIRSKSGDKLASPYTFSFKTTSFKVINTYPSNGNTDVCSSTDIRVAFTGPVDTSTVRNAFRITPATGGYFYQYYDYQFNFIPYEGLVSDSWFAVTIDTTIRSKNGDKLASPYGFSFKTSPFKVNYTYPPNGQTGVSRYINVTVEFSANIDTGTVRSAFSMPGVSGYFSINGTSYFYFYPSSTGLSANTTYTATISTALKSKAGSSLKAPYSFSFTTGN